MQRKNLWILLFVFVGLVVLGAIWFFSPSNPPVVDPRAAPVQIGAALPETGQAADLAASMRKAIDLAVSEANFDEGPERRRFEIVYVDTKLSPSQAVSGVTKLATIDNVKVIIGPMTSSEVRAVLPICEEHGVLVVSAAATDHNLSGASDFFFRTIVSDTYEGKAMAEFAFNKLGLRRLAVFYVESAGPFGVAETLMREFIALGGEVAAIEKAQPGATNLRAQLTRIKSAEVQGLYFAGFAQETASMLRQAKGLGLTLQILAHGTAEDPEVRKTAGAAAEGLILASGTISPESGYPSVVNFFKAYRARFGEDPKTYAANAYDAAKLVTSAVQECGPTVAEIRHCLLRVRDYPGATGTLSIQQNGDVFQPIRILQIREGDLVPFDQN